MNNYKTTREYYSFSKELKELLEKYNCQPMRDLSIALDIIGNTPHYLGDGRYVYQGTIYSNIEELPQDALNEKELLDNIVSSGNMGEMSSNLNSKPRNFREICLLKEGLLLPY